MIRKLLKLLLWFITGSSLLIGLTIIGFYLYYALPMQKNFAELETNTSSDCVTGDHWQVITPWNEFPPHIREIFERFNNKYVANYLARKLIKDMPYQSHLEFSIQLAIGSLEIRRHYSVQQRQELLINHVRLAHQENCSIEGITAAASYYFDKTPSQLSLAETTLLAGLTRNSSYYSPFRSPDRALQLRNQMLETLLNENSITKAEYQAAIQEPLPDKPSIKRKP